MWCGYRMLEFSGEVADISKDGGRPARQDSGDGDRASTHLLHTLVIRATFAPQPPLPRRTAVPPPHRGTLRLPVWPSLPFCHAFENTSSCSQPRWHPVAAI